MEKNEAKNAVITALSTLTLGAITQIDVTFVLSRVILRGLKSDWSDGLAAMHEGSDRCFCLG